MIKCIIWDLDDTIWTGTLSEGDKVICKEKIILAIKEFRNMGIVNSICSKNDMFMAMSKLRELEIDKYFLLPQISWCNKSEGVKKILDGFKLRQEETIFVDNSKYERDEVASVLPGIVTFDVNAVDQLLLLAQKEYTADNMGIERIHMYEIEEKRIIEKESFEGNNVEFLKSCNINMKIRKAQHDDIGRIHELIKRTHQINTSGVYYSLEEIHAILDRKEKDIYVATVEDKYGSYGKAGLAIVNKREGRYVIEVLIVSCRLLGKGISQAIISFLQKQAIYENYPCMYCVLKKTKYNRSVRTLFTMNNFKRVNELNVDLYRNNNENLLHFPEWISLTLDS